MNTATVRAELVRRGFEAAAIDRFLRFHNTNPLVWKAYEVAARKLLRDGRKELDSGCVSYWLRWYGEQREAVTHARERKYLEMYACVFIAKYPEHAARMRQELPQPVRQPAPVQIELTDFI